ncbi:MAG: hypothetical protein PHI19_06390 [Clostridia bacterium]|nr:hypothetical protein [Clostridia bacterium]
MKLAKNKKNDSYTESLHRTGRIFSLICLLLIGTVPVIYCLSAGVSPDWGLVVSSWSFILSYLAIGLIEAISYAPLLGVGGQYLAFITGNISNLKLPCALNAHNILKTPRDTEEGEIVATIAISVSSIVTTLIIILGLIPLAIFGGDIVKVLEPVTPYVIPAIFGGLGVVLLSKYFKQTIIPLGILLVVCLVTFLMGMDLGQSTMLTVGMIVSLITGFIMYGIQKKKATK